VCEAFKAPLATLGRALLLYWLVYALDFATSAYLIALGYGFAETNQFQVTLLDTPGLNSVLSWIANQNIWIALGALGIFAYVMPRVPARRLHPSFLLVLFSLVRLYGVASNVGFALQTAFGLSLAPPGYYALLCFPVLFAFRGKLLENIRLSLQHPSQSRQRTTAKVY